MSRSLRSQVVSGVLWNFSARFGQQAVQFGLSVLLARLLPPADFGSIVMLLTAIGFANLLADAGFGSALVQRSSINEEHTHSVFWLSLFAGFFTTGLMYASANLIAHFYRSPLLEPLAQAMSLSFVIAALGIVPAALLQRRMQFAALARAGFLATVVSSAVGVALAYLGWGVWSLVVLNLLNNASVMTINWIVSRWHPKAVFRFTAIKELWHYTVHLFGFSFTNYWARNSDNLLIGRAFGSAPLGDYSRAYGLMMLPLTQVIAVVSVVIFPALSSIQQDKEHVKSVYLRAAGIIALITFPMMAGLSVVAGPFVLTFYGTKWEGVIPLLRVLALVGMAQSVLDPTGWLFMSQGRTDWMFKWSLVASGLLVLSIVLGILSGSLMAVVTLYALANVLLLYPGVMIPGKLVNMRFGDLLRSIAGPLIGSGLMAALVLAVASILPSTWASWLQLGCLICVGIAVYVAFVVVFRVPAWVELLTLIHGWPLRQSGEEHVPVARGG